MDANAKCDRRSPYLLDLRHVVPMNGNFDVEYCLTYTR